MNRKLLAAVVSGALALPLVVPVQADATVYGSLRFGVLTTDDDKPGSNSMWNLGSNRSSRWGVKGSMEAGEGLTAGFKFERAVGFNTTKTDAEDCNDVTNICPGTSSGARHHHVYLSGDFGTLTFGQQDAPYYVATTWDGSQTLGGLTDFVYRSSGVSYASNLGGPFGFSVLVGSGKGGAEAESDGANHIEITTNLAAGPVNLNVGYFDDDGGQERIGGTVGGNIAAINWEVGYDSGRDSCGMKCDDDRFGFHVGYAIGDGNAYMQFSDKDSDMDSSDTDGWVFGYSHVLAPGVVVYAEHGTKDEGASGAEVSSTATVAAVKVSF